MIATAEPNGAAPAALVGGVIEWRGLYDWFASSKGKSLNILHSVFAPLLKAHAREAVSVGPP